MAGNSTQWRGRSVTSKVVLLLDAFSPSAPELSLGELSRRTGLPLSTTYRLATELVEWGGLERGHGGGYRIGLRLWEIGALAPRGESIRELALPFMNDLYEATHENVHLAVREGREALYVEKIRGRRSVNLQSRRGGRLPLHATGSGKVLLAYAPPGLVDEILAGRLKRYTPHTVVAPGHLRRELEEVRRTGVAFAREEMTRGSVSVAAPVHDARGTVVAALALVVRSARADLDRLAPATRTASISVSREIRSRGLVVESPAAVTGTAAAAT
jgi:DNA-binding IclR family transcriptional regulator